MISSSCQNSSCQTSFYGTSFYGTSFYGTSFCGTFWASFSLMAFESLLVRWGLYDALFLLAKVAMKRSTKDNVSEADEFSPNNIFCARTQTGGNGCCVCEEKRPRDQIQMLRTVSEKCQTAYSQNAYIYRFWGRIWLLDGKQAEKIRIVVSTMRFEILNSNVLFH